MLFHSGCFFGIMTWTAINYVGEETMLLKEIAPSVRRWRRPIAIAVGVEVE
jgi:hypothetical protein